MDHTGGITGTTIGGRYVLCGAMAAGGMATVHLARQLGAAGFSRLVAVKHPHEQFARHPGFVAMFLDEARLVARIRHPNVVQTLDVVSEDGELFIVMEYVHGESLLALVKECARRREAIPVPIAAALVAHVLHGLHAAHEARSEAGQPLGMVHRDVSPHNVMVGLDGIARVLDFGVAKAAQRMQETQDGKLKGKFSYMAPEQVRAEHIDRRADVYAASVMLWESLTGSSLFRRANEGATLLAILHDEARPPSFFNREVPLELDALVLRGLSRDRELRFATAEAMAHALEATLRLASPSLIGSWIRGLALPSLARREQQIGELEAESSTRGVRAAAQSLREITTHPRGGTPAGVPRPVLGSHTTAAIPQPSPSRGGLGLAIPAAVVVLVAAGGTAWWWKTEHDSRAAALLASGPWLTTAFVADAGLAPVAPACPVGMVDIPGGQFFMGSDDDELAERPAHKVTLGAYCMDVHEVTAAAYRACSDVGECKRAPKKNDWPGIDEAEHATYDPICTGEDPARGAHPINCIDWAMADRFCRAAGKRLPTEAEWELAARGSDGRRYPWGDEAPSASFLNACGPECVAWGKAQHASFGALHDVADPFPTTAPVGSFPRGASRWGLLDVVGNVWEWTADVYAPYTADDRTAPTGPATGKTRVMRGGAWNGASADWVRPSFRFHANPTLRSHGVGFRCAKTAN